MARQMSSSEVPVMSQLYLNVSCLELSSQLQGERGKGSILHVIQGTLCQKYKKDLSPVQSRKE
jgi:hypothetical protein